MAGYIRRRFTCMQANVLKVQKVPYIAVNGSIPWHSYRMSLAIWDHIVLPSTRHKWTRPALTPAIQAGTRFTYPGGMEGWVDLVDLIAPQPGVEPATFQSWIQCLTNATTKTTKQSLTHPSSNLGQVSTNYVNRSQRTNHYTTSLILTGREKVNPLAAVVVVTSVFFPSSKRSSAHFLSNDINSSSVISFSGVFDPAPTNAAWIARLLIFSS